jgi:hypothetical protein
MSEPSLALKRRKAGWLGVQLKSLSASRFGSKNVSVGISCLLIFCHVIAQRATLSYYLTTKL